MGRTTQIINDLREEDSEEERKSQVMDRLRGEDKISSENSLKEKLRGQELQR